MGNKRKAEQTWKTFTKYQNYILRPSFFDKRISSSIENVKFTVEFKFLVKEQRERERERINHFFIIIILQMKICISV